MTLAFLDQPALDREQPRTRVVFVHGFTQNAQCGGDFARHLRAGADLVLVDAPGHGESAHDDADLVEAGRLITDVGGEAHYVGYSMGGRMLLHAALDRPERMRSLTLIGATAGIEDPDERAARREADETLARRLLDDGLPAFLDAWLQLPLFATLPPEAAARTARLANRPEGLAASLRSCGTGTQESLWERLDAIDVPTLVIAGTSDTKFTSLGERLVARLPNATFAAAAGGHAIHSEQPAAVANMVSRFQAAAEW